MAETTVDTLLVKIKADMGQLQKELKKVESTTNSSSRKIQANFKEIGRSLLTLSKRLTLVGGAVAGAFSAVQIKNVVKVGMEIEGLQVRLKNLFGGAEAGQKAFDKLAKFAAKVPFSLQEIQRGAGSLAVVADNAEHLERLLTITGNAAALTGLDFATASGQIQRAFAGGAAASDLFRERGLNALLGFQAGATVTAEETAKVFEQQLGADGKFGQTTDELAQTLTGTLSMIGDKVFNFQRLIADEKFFDTVKTQFETLNLALEENSESLDKLSEQLGTALANALEKTVEGLAFMGEHLEKVKLTLGLIAGLGIVAIFGKIRVAIIGIGAAAFEASQKLHGMLERLASAMGLRRRGEAALQMQRERAIGNRGANIGGDVFAPGPDFSRASTESRPAFPTTIQARPDIAGLEDEELIKQIKILDDKIELMQINNDTEREFAEILQDTGIQTEENIKRLRERFDIIKDLEETQTRNNEVMKDAESIIEGNKTEQEKLNEQILIFEEALTNVAEEDVPKVQEALIILKEELRQLDPLMKEITQIFDRASDSISQAIADSITEGKNLMESLKDITRNVVNQMIAEFLRLQVIKPLMANIFGGMGGSRGGGGGGNIFSSLLGGLFTFGGAALAPSTGGASLAVGGGLSSAFAGMRPFAGGGSVAPNRAVMVGERGPEIFVPNSGGKIVPNHNMKSLGGQETVINQNINITTGVSQTVRAEVLNMLPAIKQETLQAVADSRLRGGTFGAAFTR